MARFAIVLSLGSVALLSVTLLLLAARPAHGQTPASVPLAPDEAAQALAERFAPVLMLKAQEQACDSSGEPYAPVSVEIVLDNPGIVLRQVGNGDPVVMTAPSASDLFGLGSSFYLDFPGDGLSPGCGYESDSRRYLEQAGSAIYAHVVQEDGAPDQLALQFWFFWYFNDWNNTHEGDWEGIQLLFDAATVEQALEGEPRSIAFAQHEGGEVAGWGDDKLERRGERPVVYPSAGSHASYFGSARYLGRSGAQGFGCDDTTGPSVEVRPRVIVLPDEVADPSDPLAWLAYGGGWGEHRFGPFSGPTGPSSKERWLEPVSWHESLRNTGVRIPGRGGVSDQLLDAFCAVAERGSLALISVQSTPLLTMLPLVLLLSVGVVVARRTAWLPALPLPLARRRSVGQILTSSRHLYQHHAGALLRVGVIYLPISLVTSGLVSLAARVATVDALLELFGERSVVGLALSALVGGLGNGLAQLFVTAAVASLLANAEGTRRMAQGGPYRTTFASLRPLVSAAVRVSAVVLGLTVTVVGIPWAIRQTVRYAFFPQVVMIEGVGAADSLRRSTDLVRGRWWHAAWVLVLLNSVFLLVAFAAGLLALILLPELPLWGVNFLMSFALAVATPWTAAAMALLYGELVARSAERDAPDHEPSPFPSPRT